MPKVLLLKEQIVITCLKKKRNKKTINLDESLPTKSTHITHPPQSRLALVYCGKTGVGGCAGDWELRYKTT